MLNYIPYRISLNKVIIILNQANPQSNLQNGLNICFLKKRHLTYIENILMSQIMEK